MASGRVQTLSRDLEAIFGGGGAAGVSDGHLLERFLGPRDEAAERAFEMLVNRHGPMVYRVCRQVLRNGQDADDAFQAVFMVLARRAGGVRNRESVGSWLYGVSLRVAARARQGTRRRETRERQAEVGLEDIPAASAEYPSCSRTDAEAVHQEVTRLAEKYRAPIVLCYLEGLTHDQAAERLKWPVGTVRSRLARGRDQLRGRLVRRGLSTPAGLGPLAGWILAGSTTVVDAATLGSLPLAAIPAELLSNTVRAACEFANGKTAAASLVSTSSLILTKGALRSMTLEKLTLATVLLLPAGALTVASGTMLAQDSGPGAGGGAAPARSQVSKRTDPTAVAPKEAGQESTEQTRSEESAAEVKKAEGDFQADWKAYEKREIDVELLLQAAHRLYTAEGSGVDPGKLLEVANRHLTRLKEIEARAEAEVKAGRGTQRALNAVHQQVEAVRMGIRLARDFKQPSVADLVEAARQRLDAQRTYYEQGRITLDRFIEASQRLMEAERLAAQSDPQRLAALRRHVDLLKEIENRERAELLLGKGTEGDVAEAIQNRVEAEIQFVRAAETRPSPDIEALSRRLADVERKLDQLLKQKAGTARP
jgi:RNA polymerase sigma-70 factor (ECF subfamily)